MRSLLGGMGAALALLGVISYAHGQKATEQYIPIGQSPGVSEKYYATVGEIAEANPQEQTVTIADAAGRRTVKITEKTRIFLDRSKLKQTNLTGRFTDLQKGRRAEIKYADERRELADWVKVELTQP